MRRIIALFIVVSVALILLFLGNIFFGSVHIPPESVWAALTGGEVDAVTQFVVIESRLPQAITALLAGASLSVSGLMLQTVFHNPLADPSILGVNSGASLGVAIVMLALGGSVSAAGGALGTTVSTLGTTGDALCAIWNAAGATESTVKTMECAVGTMGNAAGTIGNAAETMGNAAGTIENTAETMGNAAGTIGNAAETMGNAVWAIISGLSGFFLIVLAAFIGAMLIIILLLAFSKFVKSNLTLLIVGIMVGYVISSAISLLNYSATEQGVHSYIIWGLGNFNGVGLRGMPFYAISLVLCVILSLTLVKPLNTLLMGSSYARNLGTNLAHTRTKLLIVTGLIAAVVTAFCGPISFIGLAVPHIARMLSRCANHRTLMPLTLLIGADISLICALICTLPANGTLIPLNVITPLFGVPVILYVLLARREVK